MPDDLDEVVRRLQDQATIVARIQFELEAHIEATKRPLDDFNRLVMDPVDGLIVRHRHLDRSVEELDLAVSRLTSESQDNQVASRLQALEDAKASAAADAKDRKRWLVRDVGIVALVSLAVAVVTAVLVKKVGG